jgi:Family of unknown function (DUF6152)
MKAFVLGCCGAMVVAFLTLPAQAHHSAAGVDQTRTVTIVGVLKEFKWANPHSWMDIEVTDDKGQTKSWSVEMTAPAYLARAGWTSKTVKPGDKVTVNVRPMKNGDPGGLFVNITLPDGRVLGQSAAAPRAAQ